MDYDSEMKKRRADGSLPTDRHTFRSLFHLEDDEAMSLVVIYQQLFH